MTKFTLFSKIKSLFQKKPKESLVKENTTAIPSPTEVPTPTEAPPSFKTVESSKPKLLQDIKKEKQPESLKYLVRSELNLEKNAVFTVSTYKGRSREISLGTEKGPGGETYEKKAIIGRMGDGTETGVLTIHHFKLYLTLIELWEKAGKPLNEPIHFTTYKIIKRLGLEDTGEAYNRIKKWLYGLRQIPIEFICSFFIPKDGEFATLEPFSILNHLKIYERKKVGKAQKTRGYGEFMFDRSILQNLVENYVHPIRLDIILSFKTQKDLTILLYTFLDRSLAFKDYYEIGLENLFDNLDLTQNYVRYPAERKRVIGPIIQELQNKPLSTGILTYCAIEKTKDEKDYKLVCRKKQGQSALNIGIATPIKKPPKEEKKFPPEVNEDLANKIKIHKASLTSEQRVVLRQKALNKIRDNKGIKEDFISEPLIESFENELIKEELK